MHTKKTRLRANALPLLLALAQWLLSFVLEKKVLVVEASAHWPTYLVCKALLFGILFLFWRFLCRAVGKNGDERRILLYALPYLAVLTVVLLLFHPFELTSDELYIFERGTRLEDFAFWFNYFTGYYCIISLMIVPHFMGPTLLKMLLQALVAGYCVMRARRAVNGSRWGLLLYLLFLMPPMLENGISAHRMPTYGVLFLFFMAKLLFDRLEEKKLSPAGAIGMCALAAVLTYWRSEGIYLLVFGVVLMAFAYRVRGRRAVAGLLLLFYAVQGLVALPQVLDNTLCPEAPLGLRVKPFYAYAITNMLRNGADREKIAPELAVIDTYLPVESIDASNASMGDANYTGANALNYVRKDVPYEQQLKFCAACRALILKQPAVYLKSQWGGWEYTNALYPISFAGGYKNVLQSLRSLTYQLYPPLLLLVGFCILSLVRRRWLSFFMAGCGIGNWMIVLLLMPAAQFKYFYAVWLLGYFLLLLRAVLFFGGKRAPAV